MSEDDTCGNDAPRTLDDVFALVWMLLADGVRNRHSAFHTPTLATVSADGTPQARTVVLRAAVREDARLRFNTDARAPKHADMAGNPRVALHVYDAPRKTQVRVSGTVRLSAGEARAAEIWAGMRAMSRECYRQGCAPGTPLDDPEAVPRDALDDDTARANFTVADVAVEQIDWLYLRHSGHLRAGFDLTRTPMRAEWRAP